MADPSARLVQLLSFDSHLINCRHCLYFSTICMLYPILDGNNTNTRIGEDEGEFASEVRDVVSSMPLLTSMAAPEHPSHPSTLTSLDQSKSSVPEPLGPSSAQGHQGVGFALALATARSIEDLNAVPYPEDVRPNPNFNFAVTPRRFRYVPCRCVSFVGFGLRSALRLMPVARPC